MQVKGNQKTRNLVIIFMLELCVFMGMFLTTARSVILGTLLTELNGYSFYGIVVIITTMMMAVVGPIAGKLSDIWGRKIIVLSGIACYGAASFICAGASNIYIFIAGMVLIGIGYGLMNSVSGAIICDAYLPESRPKYNSYLTIASSTASLLGPVMGGIFADSIGWRYIYYSIVPIAVLAFILTFFFLEDGKNKIIPTQKFDYFGVICLVLCVIPVLFALSVGGKIFAWGSPVIIWCFIIAAIMLMGLIICEGKQSEPLIPYKLVKNYEYTMCLILTFLAWFSFSVMNYVTIFYQDVIFVSKTTSGILVIPRQVAQILTSFAVGTLLVKLKNYKLMGILSFGIYGVGMLLMSLFTAGTPIWMVFFAEICFGIGISAQSIVLGTYVQNILNPKNTGTGLAFYNFLGSLASSFGAALGGCVINQMATISMGLKTTFFIYFLFIAIGFIVVVVSKWKSAGDIEEPDSGSIS